MSIAKWQLIVVLILLSIVATTLNAQSSTHYQEPPQDTQAGGYWVDPATGLMWAAKDNGKDVTWKKTVKYCTDMRLAGYSDWRLANVGELAQIYDPKAEAPGLAGPPSKARAFTFHVKGHLFLTGNQWSASQILDDSRHPSGYAWRFDFNEGREFGGDEIFFYTDKRALCVRDPRD